MLTTVRRNIQREMDCGEMEAYEVIYRVLAPYV